MKQYTKNVGRKFAKDGSYQHFEGNTIICKVKPDCSFYQVASTVSQKIQMTSPARSYTFLPQESFHMTMIQGVCDVDRSVELWSKYLSLDAKLEETDLFFTNEFSKANPFPEIKMVFDYIDISKNIIIIRLKPEDEKSREKLKEYRNHLANLLGIQFPDHNTYGFHLSIAYQIWENTMADDMELKQLIADLNEKFTISLPTFVVPNPVLTYFKSMEYFSEKLLERSK